MKKIIKNSIKILLITIMLSSIFCPLATAATQESFVGQIYIYVKDEEGNFVYNVKVNMLGINDQYINGQIVTDQTYINNIGFLKIYPYPYNATSVEGGFELFIETVPEGYELPTGRLKLYLVRDRNDNIILKQIDENNSLEYEHTIGSKADIYNIPINITLKIKKAKIVAPELDCNVNIGNMSGITNAIQVVSNANSANASISVSDMVQYLKANGITISQITDASGNLVDLASTQVIGTDTVLTSDTDENYTTIVYGDATGDGKVDAADISVVINEFLGEDTNTSQVAKIAADVQQDGELNAADISLMINSFLGNLNGDILVKNETEPEDKTGKKLSEVVKVGDYINYPVNYTNVPTARGNMVYDLAKPTDTGWRVCLNKNGIVKLMPAGCPENVSANQINAYINNSSNFDKYLVASYASSVDGCPNADEETDAIYDGNLAWFGPIDSSTGGTSYYFWKRFEGNKIGESRNLIDGEIYTTMYNAGEEYNSFGVMPVVTLKSNLINHGGDGTKANPYKLSE